MKGRVLDMTLLEAKVKVKSYGMSLRYRDGEYRVNFLGGSEDTAYYTNNRFDAVMTAMSMSDMRNNTTCSKA